MTQASTTTFVDSFATDQLLPPWDSEDSTCWCFVIPMLGGCVQDYLDTHLNMGQTRFKYSPLRIPTQYGLIVVCVQPNIQSNATGKPRRLMKHTEVYLAVPVNRSELQVVGWEDYVWGPEKVVWVQPFAFGDNPYVIFGAREVWGMDMTHATITHSITTDNRAASPELHVDLSIMGMKTFSAQSPSTLIPGLRIAAGIAAAPDLNQPEDPKPVLHPPPGTSDIDKFRDALGENGYPMPMPPAPLEERTHSLRATAPATKALPVTHTIELNNLKQFRDLFDMNAAIYRAIVASKVIHTEIGRIIAYEPSQVELDFFWSASAQEMLTSLFGVDVPPPSPAARDSFLPCRLPVALAYSFKSNVKFKVIDTIYTFHSTDAAPSQGFGEVQTP